MRVAFLFTAALLGVALASPNYVLRSNFELQSEESNVDEPAYRLLDSVKPRHVYVHLDTYLNESRFDGFVKFDVDVEQELTQIVFHQNVVGIEEIVVKDNNGDSVNLDISLPHEIDTYYELLKINFEAPLAIGAYSIEVTYRGQINENPLDRGFYKGYYFENGEKKFYATTQFQPFHARKAFPCFDNPEFKSHFTISITRPIDFSQSYSNMDISFTESAPNNRIRETFYPTPLISAYIIAFHVSQFNETTSAGTAEKPFGIISRPGVEDQHEYATEMGVSITEWMDNYFGINYYEMGQGVQMKNDHIALPDFPSGAMENWGMVNYREAYLLYDENNTNIVNKIFIASIIAHEMAHKWFGNLVTCFWWSNLWLNESFASYYEYFGPHGVDESLELDSQFIVDYVHSSLLWDAGVNTTPMNWTAVSNNPSISDHFSTTSYGKGASVLRMMEHFVGPDTFQKALHFYLRDNQYSIGTPEAMYAAFSLAVSEDGSLDQYEDVNVGEVFDTWVQTPGAPILNVEVDNTEGVIRVSQERYIFSENIPDSLWYIPLTYTRSGDLNFSNLKPSHVMTSYTINITKPQEDEYVIFNVAQSGYYRVNYDEANWRKIGAALQGDSRLSINKFNRAQIVNDVLVYLRGNHMEVPFALEILEFLKYETDYYVWTAGLGQIEWLRRRIEHIPALQESFEEYILEQMEAVIESVGYEERTSDTTSEILNRMQILNFACNLGHEECISHSLESWQDFKSGNNPVPVNARRYVYCAAIRHGDRSDYDFLFNIYATSENTADMVVILRALGCSKDESILNHYLTESLFNEQIRIHDRTNVFQFALLGNQDNIKTVIDFLKENYADIREHYGGSARLRISINALAGFLTNFEDIVEFQEWVYSNQEELQDVFNNARSVINTSVQNMHWANNIAVDLNNFLRSRNSAGSAVVSIALLVGTMLFHLLRSESR